MQMLDTFTACGAEAFVVTKTELEWPGHKKVKWGKTYSVAELREKLPAMLRTADIMKTVRLPDGETVLAGENLIIRPIRSGVAYVQLDDLKPDQLDRIRPAVFLLHATSPGSYQGWIAVSGVPEGKDAFKEFTRRVRERVGANDKSASHATRIAGSRNWKTKYLPDVPTVTILESHPGHVLTPAQLEAMGLLGPPEPAKQPPARSFASRNDYASDNIRQWPSYEKSLAGAPPSNDGTGPDRSRADFWWCYLALQRGWSVEDTEAKLLDVSEKARERVRPGDPGYVPVTVVNAGAYLARNRQRTRA